MKYPTHDRLIEINIKNMVWMYQIFFDAVDYLSVWTMFKIVNTPVAGKQFE